MATVRHDCPATTQALQLLPFPIELEDAPSLFSKMSKTQGCHSGTSFLSSPLLPAWRNTAPNRGASPQQGTTVQHQEPCQCAGGGDEGRRSERAREVVILARSGRHQPSDKGTILLTWFLFRIGVRPRPSSWHGCEASFAYAKLRLAGLQTRESGRFGQIGNGSGEPCHAPRRILHRSC